MIVCQLCDGKFKNERGLSVHLARVHGVHGPCGRLSLTTIHQFFPLLKERRWAKAEKFLKLVMKKNEEDEWRKGYTHALRGMIIALKIEHSSPQPYILQLKSYNRRRLQEAKKQFIELSNKPLNIKFDIGYFQAWTDCIHHLLHQ